MKKKVIVLSAALMLIAASVVSAAAKWGTFEGYNIVKLVIDGKEVVPKDTPPVILKGRTMVPLAMLKDAGISVSWDPNTYTVDVETKGSGESTAELQRAAVTMDIYKILTDYYDTFHLYEISLTQASKYKDYAPYLDALSNYIDTFADFKDMEEYISGIVEYTNEEEYGATSYHEIISDYNVSIESISEAIDLFGVYFNKGTEASLIEANKLIERSRIYNESALEKATDGHSILQDYVYSE